MFDATSQGTAMPAATDALLIVDSRTGAARLGMRSAAAPERRLLFQAPGAHIELRIAPSREEAKPAWLFGMFVATGQPSHPGRVKVRLTADSAPPTEVEAMESGEFALPCNPARPFALQFLPPGGSAVRVRIEG
jgi:hypothetical protein